MRMKGGGGVVGVQWPVSITGGMSESRVTSEKAMTMVLEKVVRAVSLAVSEVLGLDIQ